MAFNLLPFPSRSLSHNPILPPLGVHPLEMARKDTARTKNILLSGIQMYD